MIGLEDRQALAQNIHAAHAAGARMQPACEIAGIDMRTLQRWKAQDLLSAGGGEQIDAISGPLHGGIERLGGDTEQGEDLELQAG